MGANDGLQLRCKLDQTKGANYTVAGTDIAAGEMRLVNNSIIIAAEAGVVGDTIFAFHRVEDVVVPCEAASTSGYKRFEKVYFDATNKRVTETSSGGNKVCGTVLKDSAVGDTELEIDFDGRLNIVS